jgi:hypothetical protein
VHPSTPRWRCLTAGSSMGSLCRYAPLPVLSLKVGTRSGASDYLDANGEAFGIRLVSRRQTVAGHPLGRADPGSNKRVKSGQGRHFLITLG